MHWRRRPSPDVRTAVLALVCLAVLLTAAALWLLAARSMGLRFE